MAWCLLGLAYVGTGQHAEAIDACRQALKINPQDPKAWCGLGGAYSLAGRYAEAIEACHQALKIEETSLSACP